MSSIACGASVFEDSGAAIAKEEQKCRTAIINVRDCSADSGLRVNSLNCWNNARII